MDKFEKKLVFVVALVAVVAVALMFVSSGGESVVFEDAIAGQASSGANAVIASLVLSDNDEEETATKTAEDETVVAVGTYDPTEVTVGVGGGSEDTKSVSNTVQVDFGTYDVADASAGVGTRVVSVDDLASELYAGTDMSLYRVDDESELEEFYEEVLGVTISSYSSGELISTLTCNDYCDAAGHETCSFTFLNSGSFISCFSRAGLSSGYTCGCND